jgi:hypothetical protein
LVARDEMEQKLRDVRQKRARAQERRTPARAGGDK